MCVCGLGTFSKKERDLEVEDGSGIVNFIKMTQTNFEVFLQMIYCKILTCVVFSHVHILSTCSG